MLLPLFFFSHTNGSGMGVRKSGHTMGLNFAGRKSSHWKEIRNFPELFYQLLLLLLLQDKKT
jgi:hypothetical protein